MALVNDLFHLFELAVKVGLIGAAAFGVANFVAGVIVTLRE